MTDFSELWVTYSTLNEGTNSLVNELMRVRKLHCHIMSAIKLAMDGTQEWRHLFTPLWVRTLILAI